MLGLKVSKPGETNSFGWYPLFEQLIDFSLVAQEYSLWDVYTLLTLFYRNKNLFLPGLILHAYMVRLKEAMTKISIFGGSEWPSLELSVSRTPFFLTSFCFLSYIVS